MARNKKGSSPSGRGGGEGLRNRENEILFIDARKLGVLVNRRNRELKSEDIKLITDTYHSWRNVRASLADAPYKDVAGFSMSATMEEVIKNNYVLMPGKYVGTEEEVSDGILFEDKMQTLTTILSEQFEKRKELEKNIRKNLLSIGYGF